MMDFLFRRRGPNAPLIGAPSVCSEGSLRIYGQLLDELKALKRGQKLVITSTEGKVYVIVNEVDFVAL